MYKFWVSRQFHPCKACFKTSTSAKQCLSYIDPFSQNLTIPPSRSKVFKCSEWQQTHSGHTCRCYSSAWRQLGGIQRVYKIRHYYKLRASPRSGRFPTKNWILKGQRAKERKGCCQWQRTMKSSLCNTADAELFVIVTSITMLQRELKSKWTAEKNLWWNRITPGNASSFLHPKILI